MRRAYSLRPVKRSGAPLTVPWTPRHGSIEACRGTPQAHRRGNPARLRGSPRSRGPHRARPDRTRRRRRRSGTGFKSAARFNLHTRARDPDIEYVIVKSVAGFANASGGPCSSVSTTMANRWASSTTSSSCSSPTSTAMSSGSVVFGNGDRKGRSRRYRDQLPEAQRCRDMPHRRPCLRPAGICKQAEGRAHRRLSYPYGQRHAQADASGDRRLFTTARDRTRVAPSRP